MLRGEILSRWQDLVGTGEFMRSVEQRIGALRDRITGWFTGDEKVEAVEVAISDSLAAVVKDAGERAAEATAVAWSHTRWGRDIVSAVPALTSASEGFDEVAAGAIRALAVRRAPPGGGAGAGPAHAGPVPGRWAPTRSARP
jgi:hypothetical protein